MIPDSKNLVPYPPSLGIETTLGYSICRVHLTDELKGKTIRTFNLTKYYYKIRGIWI